MRKQNLIRALSILLGWVILQPLVFASQFLYVVDTSGSMRSLWRGGNVVTTVRLDIERALSGPGRIFQEGDQIHIWSFDLKVQERLSVEFRSNSTTEIRRKIASALDRLTVKIWGKTSLAKPLSTALERFRPPEAGNLDLLLYTDGKNSIDRRDHDRILSIYNHDYRQTGRLSRLQLVQFGDTPLPDTTRDLVASLSGQITAPGAIPIAETPPAPELSPLTTVITVSPESIHFAGPMANEIAKPIPIQFTLNPPSTGLSVVLSLLTTNLPSGMTITTTADRLATEGKQSVSFLIRNPQAGHFSAKLKLTAPVPIRPDLIPVDIDILPASPDNVVIQFFPERVPSITLPAASRWQKFQGVGVSFFYPEKLGNTLVRLEVTSPDGTAVRMIPGDSPEIPVASGGVFRLAKVGSVAGFEVRPTSTGLVGHPLEAKIAITVQPGQGVSSVGTNSVTIPFQFSSATEVEIETSEISLGEIPRGVKSVKRTLVLTVRGQPEGSKLLVVKQGQGLAGIEIQPSEILLEPGTRSVDLEFTGFDERAPGSVEGVFVMIPERPNPALYVPLTPIQVRGMVSEPSKIFVEIENSMVVGQPLIIRARFDSGERGTMQALINPPKSGKTHQLDLEDSGSAEDGDIQADDGIYSAVFHGTDQLGSYQIIVSGKDLQTKTRTALIKIPVYFQGSSKKVVGTLSLRRSDQSIEFKPQIVSDYPGGLTVDIEPGSDNVPLSTYLSSKRLEPGTNAVGLLIRLTPEAGPGDYSFNLHLVTQTIGGAQARIPIAVELRVESLFQYFMKLFALAVSLGIFATAVIVIPWNRVDWLNRLRGKRVAQLPPPGRFDDFE
ncbi:MAG: VWA domain-containing protein [Verrucomicrobia bacterium]|nr:VWA domain-containing protein [Verrucomicrobiota bacterium]